MNICVINKSTVLKDTEVQSWMPAFNKFLAHVRYWWPRPSKLVYYSIMDEPLEAWKVIFADTSDEAGALGYHDFTPSGRPISYIFAKDDLEYGYNPTVTATHEIAEMVADPWISQLFQVSNNSFYAQEICDPCEADDQGYEIDGVMMSDFVTPRYFIPGSEGYTLDHCKRITGPLQLLPGGYMSVFTSGKGWSQIYADKANGEVKEVTPSDMGNKNAYGRLLKYGLPRPRAHVGGLVLE